MQPRSPLPAVRPPMLRKQQLHPHPRPRPSKKVSLVPSRWSSVPARWGWVSETSRRPASSRSTGGSKRKSGDSTTTRSSARKRRNSAASAAGRRGSGTGTTLTKMVTAMTARTTILLPTFRARPLAPRTIYCRTNPGRPEDPSAKKRQRMRSRNSFPTPNSSNARRKPAPANPWLSTCGDQAPPNPPPLPRNWGRSCSTTCRFCSTRTRTSCTLRPATLIRHSNPRSRRPIGRLPSSRSAPAPWRPGWTSSKGRRPLLIASRRRRRASKTVRLASTPVAASWRNRWRR
mmetsp:Transcript_8574/g.25416  ORF Transcript_8574/g.25416 Transcript_8574/m.25416 type:complete len:288 (+) Transcript_8574:3473-4336(+)